MAELSRNIPLPMPEPHPEKPPPNIPIPGTPSVGVNEKQKQFKCKVCGKVFNSKEELKAHMETDHCPEEEARKSVRVYSY